VRAAVLGPANWDLVKATFMEHSRVAGFPFTPNKCYVE